jgi:drug/metabolite transporter (DMT)-like permease
MFLAALIFLPWHLSRMRRAARVDWPSKMLLWAGAFFAFDLGFFHIALTHTSVAHATLIVNLAPLVAIAAGVMFFSERFGSAKAIGLVVALTGAALMTAARSGDGQSLYGDALAGIGMIAYAFYLIAVKFVRRTADFISVMMWSSAVAGILLLGAAALKGETLLPQSWEGLAAIFALGAVVHAGGQGLIASGMRYTPVGVASIVLLIQPVIAGVAAWAMFGESLTGVEALGAAAVFGGIAVAARSRA